MFKKIINCSLNPEQKLVSLKHFPLYGFKPRIARQDLVQALYTDVIAHKPVLIRGFWRVGKTTAALHLKQLLEENGQPVIFCSISEVFKCDEEHTPNRKFIEATAPLIDDSSFSIVNEDGQIDFSKVNELAIRKGQRFTLIFDEVISIIGEPSYGTEDDRRKIKQICQSTLEKLHSITTFSNLNLVMVLHYNDRYEEEISRLFPGYSSHFVKPITKAEVKKLLDYTFEGSSYEYDQSFLDRLFEITEGRTIEIADIINTLAWESKNNSHTYTSEDIKALISIFYLDDKGSYIRTLIVALTHIEDLLILSRIALGQTISRQDPSPETSQRLENLGLIKILDNNILLIGETFKKAVLETILEVHPNVKRYLESGKEGKATKTLFELLRTKLSKDFGFSFYPRGRGYSVFDT